MQHILLQIRLIYAVKMFFFYRRLRPDLHSASHIHFQVHICITFTKPNNFPVSSQSSIHNFFIENVTDSFFFVFYLIFNQSCIYIYLPLCPLNPVCVDFSPRINDDSIALTSFDQIRIRIPSLWKVQIRTWLTSHVF